MKSSHLHNLKMGTEFVSETLENFHILMRLSARENFIEFCRSKSFRVYGIAEVQEKIPKISTIKHWVKEDIIPTTKINTLHGKRKNIYNDALSYFVCWISGFKIGPGDRPILSKEAATHFC
jgi:hypothetical protein